MDPFSERGIGAGPLDGPPPPGFDCAREAQNRFLYDAAWHDQQRMLSVTYVYSVNGTPAAFSTVLMSTVVLGTREKPASIRYKQITAMKLAQLGVDRRFQGAGLGQRIVADMIGLAREESRDVGCRYLVLDAEPELVPWYERQGFRINQSLQRQRIEAAGDCDPAQVAVSMRFDLEAA